MEHAQDNIRIYWQLGQAHESELLIEKFRKEKHTTTCRWI